MKVSLVNNNTWSATRSCNTEGVAQLISEPQVKGESACLKRILLTCGRGAKRGQRDWVGFINLSAAGVMCLKCHVNEFNRPQLSRSPSLFPALPEWSSKGVCFTGFACRTKKSAGKFVYAALFPLAKGASKSRLEVGLECVARCS